MLPLAQWHINTSPTAALGGRCPYWARFGVMPNVSQMPSLSALFKLMGFDRSDAQGTECWRGIQAGHK